MSVSVWPMPDNRLPFLSSKPLPYVLNQDPKRPDICIGTCEFHTPKRLIDYALEWASPYSVYLNRPFSGTFVPSEYYLQDKRVSSIMVEVNQKPLYG